MPFEPSRVERDDRHRGLPRLQSQTSRERDGTLRAQPNVLQPGGLDIEAHSVEPLSGGRPEAEHRERAAQVEGRIDVTGEIPRDDLQALCVERLDELRESYRPHDVDGCAVVRGLDPDGRDVACCHASSRPLGCREHPAVVDVDPGAKPTEDGIRRRLCGGSGSPTNGGDGHRRREHRDEESHPSTVRRRYEGTVNQSWNPGARTSLGG